MGEKDGLRLAEREGFSKDPAVFPVQLIKRIGRESKLKMQDFHFANFDGKSSGSDGASIH